ncbi:MAG: hypothetical protein HYY48_12235 [Gammaproteobacteria bacterium]|nr:hypothetical protein [Gammaproteobacteria bacterium]
MKASSLPNREKRFAGIALPALFVFGGIGAGTAAAADISGNHAVWGLGGKSCFAYIQAGAQGADRTDYRDYVMGYLTAYNAVTPDTYRIEGHMDLDQIMNWIGEYCDAKPMHGFEQALADFAVEHTATRLQRAPQRSGR